MFGVAVVLVLPALGLLFTLAQRDLIQESEGPARDFASIGMTRERSQRNIAP